MKSVLIPLLLFALFMGCGGCATLEEDRAPPDVIAFRALTSSLNLYNLTMESVAELQKSGFITTEQRTEINRVANIYRSAHLAATQALRTYRAVESAETQEDLLASSQQVALALAELTQLVAPFLMLEVANE